jgi:hypothetical protein
MTLPLHLPLRFTIEVSTGDVSSVSKTLCYRFVGGIEGDVSIRGQWRRHPADAFSAFLIEFSRRTFNQTEFYRSRRLIAESENVVRKAMPYEQLMRHHNGMRKCGGCGGLGDLPTLGEDGLRQTCPDCGGYGTAYGQALVEAEQVCLAVRAEEET